MEFQAAASKCTTNQFAPNNSDNKSAESQYQQNHSKNQQLIKEKTLEEKQNCTLIIPTEYENKEEEENENKHLIDKMCYSDARMGVCSVCRVIIKENNDNPIDFGKALLCSNGHFLCHQCVLRLEILTDTNCILCVAAQSEKSVPMDSSNNSNKRSKSETRSKRKSRISIPRTRRKQHNEIESYGTTIPASYTNIDSHYIDMKYASNYVAAWNDSEGDNAIEELILDLPHAQQNAKQRNYCNVIQKVQTVHMTNVINGQMMSESSRRPIQCPLFDCAVNVAFSALTNHFIFDHPEIPILNVNPGEKSTLIVNFDGLIYNSSQCLALLLVSNKLSGLAAKQFSGTHVHPEYKNRLPLPILAARLHCDASHKDNVSRKIENHSDRGDVVIAWVAGLDIGNTTNGALRCSIQAIDNINNEACRSLTYTGPINSLRYAQKPREVFFTGDCVILHHGFINQITTGCEKLNVNVTIH